MDLLLLFNLLLGSLLVFPYLSKGQNVEISMPDYEAIGTDLRIKCSYSNFKQVLALSLMVDGNEIVKVSYDIDESTKEKPVYTKSSNSRIKLEIKEGTTSKNGAFTFVMQKVECKDFKSYTCVTDDNMKSIAKQLQVRPGIGSITPNMMELSVHQVYIFTCRGTVSKDGPFDVQWYRRTITQANRLIPTQQAQIMNVNECSRSVESQLSYNVTESDVPNLILWCKIDGGQSVEDKKNYTVQEMTTIAATPGPQPVKAGLDPGSIVGIVLGIIALIVLIVLVVWFLVIRPKRLKADGSSKEEGPEPNAKDYQQNHKTSSTTSLSQAPDTNSNSLQDTGTAGKQSKPSKQSAFLPSHGDATDNMDEAYELPPPPPPPPQPKPHRSPRIEAANPLHYAELELAVQKSAKRRSEYEQRPNTDYAVISHS